MKETWLGSLAPLVRAPSTLAPVAGTLRLRRRAVAALCLAAACTNETGELGIVRPHSGGVLGSAAGGGNRSESIGSNTGTASVAGLTAWPSGSGATASAANGGGTGAVASRPAGSSTEVCDGVDNDENGIVDDVDAEMDGVCDCLNIATIGAIGPWSNGGNVFKQWLDLRSPRSAVELGNQIITDELLEPYQVIVLLYVATFQVTGMVRSVAPHHTFSPDEVAAFERWVSRGGGVLTTTGYSGDEQHEVENVNRLLAPFSLGYVTVNQELHGYIEAWTPHPVTDGVMRIFTDNGVPPMSSVGLSLARDSSGHLALQVAEVGLGHVVVWGDDWITYDSQWQDVRDQQVERLWLNIFKWLSPGKVCQVPTPELL